MLFRSVVTRSTWWDSILFDGMRKDVHLHALRSLIFDGPVLQSRLDFFRIALGVPTISSQGHAFLLAPLSAAMMWDFQRLPPPGMEENEGVQEKGSVGPPVSGVELKLRGDEAEIAAGRVKGEVRSSSLRVGSFGIDFWLWVAGLDPLATPPGSCVSPPFAPSFRQRPPTATLVPRCIGKR